MPDPVASLIAAVATPTAANVGVLVTGLLLGIRHGIDWDHIAAITDITSTTAAAGTAEAAHAEQHREISGQHHGHGGQTELRAHDAGPGAATLAPATAGVGAIGRWKLSSAWPMSATRIGVPVLVATTMSLNSPDASTRPSVRRSSWPLPCSTVPPGISTFSATSASRTCEIERP